MKKNVLLSSLFAFLFFWNAQAQQPCGQTQVSNNFQASVFIDESVGQMIANDFLVSPSTTVFSVESIIPNLFSQGGIESMDVYFYENNGGVPGEMIGSPFLDIVPASQTIIGSAFGYDVYEVVIDLPTSIGFSGSGTSAPATYWVQLVAEPNDPATNVGWELTSNDVIGNRFAAKESGSWEPAILPNDGVFTIEGTCTYISCPQPTDLAVSNIGDVSADISWTEVGDATAWEIEYGESGFELGDGTIVQDTDGAPGETITGLTSHIEYDVYVTSVCGTGTESFPTGPVDFFTFPTPPECGELFTDTGGTEGNYGTGEHLTYIIEPETSGNVVTLDFTLVNLETCCDKLTVYNGIGTSGFVLAEDLEAPASFISSAPSGALTVVFDSDGSVTEMGWEADVICGPAPPCPTPINLMLTGTNETSAEFSWNPVTEAVSGYEWFVFATGADPDMDTAVDSGTTPSGTATANADGLEPGTEYDFYVRANCDADGTSNLAGPLTFRTKVTPPVCGEQFYDSGGPDGDYGNGEHTTWTIVPTDPDDVVSVTFNSFSVEDSYDALYVFDGPSTSSPKIESENLGTASGFPAGGYYGTSIPGPFTSSHPSGALTFVFRSDGSATEAGWEANVTCAPLAIDEQVFEGFEFYPNPVKNKLWVKAPERIKTLVLYDLNGKKVFQTEPTGFSTSMNLGRLQTGVYFMKVKIGGAVKVYKLIKK